MSIDNRIQTKGLVLRRVNYGEADRVVTVITPDAGKISFIAKAVRKPKSKLAGGIELFAINDLTIMSGKGELAILISARAEKAFRGLVRDYDVIQVGYRVLDIVDKATEDDAPTEYYQLIVDTLELLNESKLDHRVVEGWMTLHFLRMFGNAPSLTHDEKGKPLEEDKKYSLHVEEGNLVESQRGSFTKDTIKAWRVLLTSDKSSLKRVSGLKGAFSPSLEELRRFCDYVR